MTQAEAALLSILSDVEAARRHQARQGKGGQQCGGPPALWSVPHSALIHLSRTVCHGLGEAHSPEVIARLLGAETR